MIPLNSLGVPGHVIEREVEAQLQDLSRMRKLGMAIVERLDRRGRELQRLDEPAAFETIGDICLGFARVSRAVRQIIVLEQEILGLRQPPGFRAANINNVNTGAVAAPALPVIAPGQEDERDSDRSDLNDLNDYDNGPRDAVIARLTAELGIVDSSFPVMPSHASSSSSVMAGPPPKAALRFDVAQSATGCVTQKAALRAAGSGHDDKTRKNSKSPLKAVLLNGASFHSRGPPS